MCYREAVAMGLDRDDLVIRRRLAVKMEFLTDDVAEAATPADEQLQTFLGQHPEKFSVESLTSFTQVYIDRSRRGEGASAEAKRVLALLDDEAGTDSQSLGDPLPLPNEYETTAEADVARVFGRAFPRKLAELPLGRWSGRWNRRTGCIWSWSASVPPGEFRHSREVRDAVLSEWRLAQRLDLNANLRRQLRTRYAVSVEWPDWAKESVPPTAGRGVPGGGP